MKQRIYQSLAAGILMAGILAARALTEDALLQVAFEQKVDRSISSLRDYAHITTGGTLAGDRKLDPLCLGERARETERARSDF